MKSLLRRPCAGLAAAIVATAVSTCSAWAQTYPSDGPAAPPPSEGGGRGGGGGGGGAGVGISIDLGPLLRSLFSRPAPEAVELAQGGPRLPEAYAFASLSFPAVLKGGWPAVVAYDIAPGAEVEIEFATTGADPQRFRLPSPPADAGGRERVLLTFELPARLGKELTAGMVSMHVLSSSDDARKPVVRLHGLGAGPLAVGSVAIDNVVFEPEQFRLATGQRAYYGFHSKSDFSRAGVDIARLERQGEGVRLVRVRSDAVRQSIARNAWVGREPPLYWDGRTQNGQPSLGPHLLYVRAWAADAGDWVIAWSPRAVEVRP
ncbi:MAG: hypothetical protein J0M28_15555 [Thauera sp.]|nr:hypothetical protein [Thauera sp.]